MNVNGPKTMRNDLKRGIPAPVPRRHSRNPSVGSNPNIPAPANSNKIRSFAIQVMLILLLGAYICLPSHTVRHISSKTSLSQVSKARRKVLSTISNVTLAMSGENSKTSGVAIVAACMNRQDTLAKVLPTWLAVDGVREVVIVDWSSDPPLKSVVQPDSDERLNLYRVNNESAWVLSRAYNLALNKTERQFVIRTDCDYSLDPGLLLAHSLNETETGFYSGNWMLARDENEVHLNGAMVMKRETFWNVGGYDERIQTYGWDDEDLYTRLIGSNQKKLNVSYDHVSHVTHGDGSRTQKGVKFAQVQIDVNQLLLEKLPQWSRNKKEGEESSRYSTILDDRNGYVELQAVHVPKPLKRCVNETEYEAVWAMALGRRLADDFFVPWDVLGGLDSNNKELLLRSLMSLQSSLDMESRGRKEETKSDANEVPLPTEARMLIVHCMHGLGNRLRALGSALAFAKHSRRVPVVIWESDAHIAAEISALFNTSDLVVMKKFIPVWPFTELHKWDASWSHFKFYNYMEMEEGAEKGRLISNEPSKHLYYKGAYVMEAPQYTWWEADNNELKSMEPVEPIRKELSALEDKGLSKAIGVHIRNRTLERDIRNVDFTTEYGSEAAATMEHWRTQSAYTTFVGEMERILKEEDKNAMFYIATDTWEVIALMDGIFPGKILSTKRTCDDRDSECVKYAVIDMYALSRTSRLLGSNWSSYTEMAERLGGHKAKLAGQDFGAPPPPSRAGKNRIIIEGIEEKSQEELEAEETDRIFDTSRER